MEVIIRPTKDDAEQLAAQIIGKVLSGKPHLVLGLATGRTMERIYYYLVRQHREQGLDFSLCRTFNLDEYVGLSPANRHSYRYYMNLHLFNQVNIDPRNTFLPDGMATDLSVACRDYEEKMREFGGIDLQLLGIGRSGHIGFNEPLSALRSRTREKALTPMTVAQNSPLFDDGTPMPKRALTMGVGTILEAERILLVVTGSSKAEVLAKAVEGPITSMISASALQLHPRCTVICDESAGANLVEKEYYRWIFENEPEWQEFRQS